MELTGVFLFIFTMLFGWAALIGGATFFGVRAMKRRLLGEGSKSSTALLPAAAEPSAASIAMHTMIAAHTLLLRV